MEFRNIAESLVRVSCAVGCGSAVLMFQRKAAALRWRSFDVMQ